MKNITIPVLIGGTHDRSRLSHDDGRMELTLPQATNEKAKSYKRGVPPADRISYTDTYRRERITFATSGDPTTISFFVHSTLTPVEAFQRLLHSYSGKLK